MVISTYSNILLNVNMINMTYGRVRVQPKRSLRLFEVLTKPPKRLGTLKPYHARDEKNPILYNTPENNCPLPYGWRYEVRSVTQVVNMDTRIHKERNTEREKERDKERDTLIYTTYAYNPITHVFSKTA